MESSRWWHVAVLGIAAVLSGLIIWGDPSTIELVGGLTAIAVGAGYACGVTGDRGVVCWTFPPAPRHRPRSRSRRPRLHTGTPYRVAGLSDVVRVTAEGETLCALRSDATMWCGSPTESGATLAQVRWE